MLPIGKMLMVPARIVGVMRASDNERDYRYMIELSAQPIGAEPVMCYGVAIDDLQTMSDPKTRRIVQAAKEREDHPNGWPT